MPSALRRMPRMNTTCRAGWNAGRKMRTNNSSTKRHSSKLSASSTALAAQILRFGFGEEPAKAGPCVGGFTRGGQVVWSLPGEDSRSAGISSRKSGTQVRSKYCVNEWGQPCSCQNNQHCKKQQHDQDRQQPPLFVLPEEKPYLIQQPMTALFGGGFLKFILV